MMRVLLAASLAGPCLAQIPDWDEYKLADFCGGVCPSTPDSSRLPQYGQKLFPALTSDASGNLYLISAKFGGAFLDNPQLISLSSSGDVRWNLTDMLADEPQNSYSLRVIGEELFVQSSSCCAADGAYTSHIAKMSLDGTALWNIDVEGTPQIGPDGIIYSIATPNTGHGSFVYAMSQDGKVLWNYTDGTSMFRYLEVGGPSAKYALCMPAQVRSNATVVCLDGSGNLAHTEFVTNDNLIRFDLLAMDGRYFVRRNRDNSYYMRGMNVLYEIGTELSVDFPDDINFVGPISHMSNGTILVLTRPDCPSSVGQGCRPDSLVALTADLQPRWNVTLPGDGDVTVNPAYPPQFGPYSSGSMAFASTVKSLQSDNTTFDMWYTALTHDGDLAWKLPMANVQDLTRVTYTTNAMGDFHVIFDGVLYRVPAVQSLLV